MNRSVGSSSRVTNRSASPSASTSPQAAPLENRPHVASGTDVVTPAGPVTSSNTGTITVGSETSNSTASPAASPKALTATRVAAEVGEPLRRGDAPVLGHLVAGRERTMSSCRTRRRRPKEARARDRPGRSRSSRRRCGSRSCTPTARRGDELLIAVSERFRRVPSRHGHRRQVGRRRVRGPDRGRRR